MEPAEKHKDREEYLMSDKNFNMLFPEHIRLVAAKHWTPLEVAEKSARFLSTHQGARVLDIGSGAGKFCLVAAFHHPEVHFTGVEQRADLVELCDILKDRLKLPNLTFIHANVADFDISPFDHYYFYNSFYENIPGTQKIDYKVKYSEQLYDYYNRALYKKLSKAPSGTRLVTYHSLGREVPPGFEVIGSDYADFLRFWQKV